MRGWWTVGRLRGIPISLHWSLPLGAVLFGGLSFSPGFYVAFAVVVLIHELGHAAMVRATGHRVSAVLLHGGGGECQWYGDETAIERAIIAWGGVWGQIVLALVSFIAAVFLPPSTAFMAQLVHGLTVWNLWMAAINLIPVRPFDGVEAWPLPRLLLQRRRAKKARRLPKVERGKVLPFVQRTRPISREFDPLDDDAPLSDEAKKVVELAGEIAKRATRAEKEKKDR